MQDLSVYFRALADRKRMRVVEYLAERDRMTVTQLGEEMHLSQPLISWHLRILRKAGIVKTQRSGRQVWCSLDRANLRVYQEQMAAMFGLDETAESAGATPLEPIGKR
jgi:ArsR family transcriptional regulator, arsenate/arsenite/antimonite-responsive transcriptional repressor